MQAVPEPLSFDSGIHQAETIYNETEKRMLAAGLVDIQSLDSSIQVELKYSTTDNFTGMDVYGELTHCFFQKDVADKIIKAQQLLKSKYPFYTLIIYDGTRPLHIQQMMWDSLPLSPGIKQKYLTNPETVSLHNYGAAVDLSIMDDKGFVLDMGTPYDYFGEKAHPEKEQEMLKSGELLPRHIYNRELLRDVMYRSGFTGIKTEWWHFNSCSRAEASGKYQVIE
ncbi:MAG: M15 family metallopeptidase [Bacteroidia bacterium]